MAFIQRQVDWSHPIGTYTKLGGCGLGMVSIQRQVDWSHPIGTYTELGGWGLGIYTETGGLVPPYW